MKIVGEAISAVGGLRSTSRAHRVSRLPSLPSPDITGLFGLKPMCNDAPRQRERMWQALVATDCYQLRNKGTRFSKSPRAIFSCLGRPTVRAQMRDYSGRTRSNLGLRSLIKLFAKRKMKIRIQS